MGLFANEKSKQMPEYYSISHDAMTLPWKNKGNYAFPPTYLIASVIARSMCDQLAHLLLVTLYWKSQPWYLLLLRYSTRTPLLLTLPMPDTHAQETAFLCHPSHASHLVWELSFAP
jgi:hypothetical protein